MPDQPAAAPKDIPPSFDNAPYWDYSSIYAKPKPDSCQSVAVGYVNDLHDEGYPTAGLAEVILPASTGLAPENRLHYIATFPRGGETWAMDPLSGRAPVRVSDLPYIFVGREKPPAQQSAENR